MLYLKKDCYKIMFLRVLSNPKLKFQYKFMLQES